MRVVIEQLDVPPPPATTPFARGIVGGGTTIAQATTLAAIVNVVETVPAGAGVMLQPVTGNRQQVLNRGQNPLSVYPRATDQIEQFGVGSAATIAPGDDAWFAWDGDVQWFVA